MQVFQIHFQTCDSFLSQLVARKITFVSVIYDLDLHDDVWIFKMNFRLQKHWSVIGFAPFFSNNVLFCLCFGCFRKPNRINPNICLDTLFFDAKVGSWNVNFVNYKENRKQKSGDVKIVVEEQIQMIWLGDLCDPLKFRHSHKALKTKPGNIQRNEYCAPIDSQDSVEKWL